VGIRGLLKYSESVTNIIRNSPECYSDVQILSFFNTSKIYKKELKFN